MRRIPIALLVALLVPSSAGALPAGDTLAEDSPAGAYRRFFTAVRAFPNSAVSAVARDSALSRIGQLPVASFRLNVVGGTPRWKSIGPTNIGGRVTDIAIDPDVPSRWFVTTVGGVWRTIDAGHRWERVSDPDASGAGMRPGVFGAVVVVPGSGEVLVGGGDPSRFESDRAGGKGLWHSLAFGDPGSWAPQSAPEVEQAVVFRLRVGPAPDRDVYAATSVGLYWRHHLNGALVWERYPSMASPCSDVLVDDRVSPPVLEVTTYTDLYRAAGIWRHDASGWKDISPAFGLLVPGPIALARAPSDGNVLFARVSRRGNHVWDDSMLGVFRSESNGTSWTRVTPTSPASGQFDAQAARCRAPENVVRWDSDHENPPYAGYSSVLAVDPQNPKIVYCGGRRILRSEDGGVSWCVLTRSANPSYRDDTTPPASRDMRNSFAHDDVHAIAFDQQGGRRVIVGDDGGLHGLESDLSLSNFYWTDLGHGLDITEFYRLATQQADVTVLAGGTQDNGGLITFGNRTWYRGFPCDVQEIAVDAAFGSTMYGHCNCDAYGHAYEAEVYPSLVPGTSVRYSLLRPNLDVYPPLAASRTSPRRILGYRRTTLRKLAVTSQGTSWSDVTGGELLEGIDLTALAQVDAAGGGSGYYAAYADDPSIPGTKDSGVFARPDPSIAARRSTLPNYRPNAIAVDPRDPNRAVIAMNGAGQTGNLVLTTDGGVSWTTRPTASPATGAAWDPFDSSVLYVATDVGVLRGNWTGTTVSLARCDDGLPGPVSVNDIQMSRSGTISIGTMGYGAYQLDLRPTAIDRDVALCVRDDVFDHGDAFVPNLPDPEHPVTDPLDNRYLTAASGAAGLQYFNSTDIRIDVPARSEVKNQVESVDHVAFESTPVELGDGFPGTIVDRAPHRGDHARVYVQVTNLGSRPAHNVRVFVMWRDPTVGQVQLPADFWTATFPTPDPTCGPFDASSGWNPLRGLPTPPATVGPDCVVLRLVRPEIPEVAGFEWEVPSNAPDHVCLVAFVESLEDPLDSTLRGMLDLDVLVPRSRHFAQRNLYPVDAVSSQLPALEIVSLPQSLRPVDTGFTLRFERPWQDRSFRLWAVLPPGSQTVVHGMHPEPIPARWRTSIKESGFEFGTMFVADSLSSSIEGIRLSAESPRKMLLIYDRSLPKGSMGARRFIVSSEREGRVLGGATWIIRRSPDVKSRSRK